MSNQKPNNPETTSPGVANSQPQSSHAAFQTPQTSTTTPPPASQIHNSSADSSLPLPAWLLQTSDVFPDIYKKASDLVSAQDGWVDTSRSYMLLMKTGLPPPLLGVLWEMVNRTKPGCLRTFEFHGLLALVALVQVMMNFNVNILSDCIMVGRNGLVAYRF